MDVTLSWTANSDSDLLKYRVYDGPSTGVYDHSTDVNAPTTTLTITGLSDSRTRYFAVSAIDNALNEGTKSSEVNAINKYIRY